MDRKFLVEKVYPYFEDVNKYFFGVMIKDDQQPGKIRLPLSSSPEYNNNAINAWFQGFTNYDLALVKNFYKETAEIKQSVHDSHGSKLNDLQSLLPSFAVDETGFKIADDQDLTDSHRHHAHLMSVYPFGLMSPDDTAQLPVIRKSLRWLEEKGTRNWCGYSFSWAASIYARAKEADNAARMLEIFTSNFCSPNSFHLNGDQKGGQYSSLTYRPFTLEGNFAFAQAIHEMLLQSYNGYIEIFPAVPAAWKNVSFHHLRTEGAFLISAKKENGVTDEIVVTAEMGGELTIKLPFKTWMVKDFDRQQIHNNENNVATVILKKGQTITFKNGYE